MSSYSSLSRVLSPFRVQTNFEENSLSASSTKRYMADITLYCYLLDTPINSAIPVDIGETTRVEGVDVPIEKFTFGHLKKQIWPNNNEANKLRLWKFETPFKKDNEQLKTLNENFRNDAYLEQVLGEDLSPGEFIRTIFPVGYVFPPNHIHIVVQPPPPATGPSHQGVPQVTSIEDAMKKILEGIHKKMDVDNVDNNKPKPMALKQRDLKQAIDVIDRNFCNSLDKQEPIKKETPRAKTNYRILLCGGAPGIGKTRYGVELFNCLDKEWKISKGQKPYMLYMLLDLTNGYALDEYEIQGNIKIASEIILGLRLAYHYLVHKKYVMSFTVFRTKSNEYKQCFRLNNVLLYIHNLEHENLIQRGKHLFIFLQIDEFQLIFKERNGGGKLFKQLMYTLGNHMTGEIPEVFVQTLLSGTAPQDAIRAMEPTMYSIEPLDLPLLSLESRLEIMREFATNHDVSDCVWVPKVWIHQLLLDTGGLPRALEYLFAEFFGQDFTRVKEFFEDLEKKKLIPSTIYTSVSKDIDTAYKIKPYAREHKMLIYELVYRNIMEIESDISDVLQDGDHSIKLEHLERDRHLILRRLEEQDKVQIDIPYFFMYHYASVLGVFTEHLNHAFLPDEIWSWQNWEKFIADFITSRINIIDVLNKEKLLKLGNFFRGSGSNVTLGQLINFGSVEIYELNHQFPCLNLSAKEGKTAVLKPGYIMINGYSAPFADIFFLVDEPDPILIAIQCRLRKNLLNLKTIEDEHKRNANISHKMEEKARKLKNDSKIASREKKKELRKEAEGYTQLGNLLSKYRVITIFVTTQRFNEELERIPNDCILIHQEKFDTFFGPLFSSRTKFVMTRDSNPNLSTASQLTSRYKAISQDIGERIEQTRKRRIFRSHEEFCEEFEELADVNELRDDFIYYPYPPYIEPFEHSNKRTRV
ncbi:unnamed protein product [Rhizophagus irregularis]|uniref:Crinkler effector protein N-terminal domain-containing protein n=1 Tax=Rhizophagus irregularis TaxID=588596 RepID=A0A915ZMF0_9GLOM|nr:unnamed protein product [Rhizophagus irregularis]